MDSARWKQIKAAYARAAELPQTGRSAFLSSIPEDIRPDVEKLLGADSEAGEFIQKPFLIERGGVSDSSGYEGRQIDDYILLEEIGSGGMGTVYLAEHKGDGFSQKAALKLIKRGMDTNAVLKRFLMERQILANLEHPFIARMLDGGSTDDGLPYFVMEHVDGVSIKTYCESNRLDTRKRLELFVKVCSAVSYAHQNLVVHRDLKPSNILINKDGDPKLLDFGIAKLVSPDWNASEAATATQFRILTPEYASPEQFRGEMTTTGTDVYSLGVVLYEILTGRRPFQFAGMSSSEIAEVLLSQEPVKPSTAAVNPFRVSTVPDFAEPTEDFDGNKAFPIADSKSLKGDLDNIVLKAIRREPERRYASVQEMADDIQRHLDGLPVTATADTLSYRAGKFVSRHRTAFSAAVLVTLLLVASTSFAIWQAFRADAQRAAAEERFNDVRSLANSLIFDLHDSIENLPGSTPARKILVSRALEYLDKLAKEGSNDMSLQTELAAGYEKIADVQGGPLGPNLGEIDGAIESYGKALSIRQTLFEKGTADDKYATAMLHSKLFRIMQVRGQMDEAETHCRQAANILEKLSAADDQTAALYRITAARFYQELGDVLVTKTDGDGEQALENYRKSISLSESIPPSPAFDETGADGLSLKEKILSVTQMAHRRLGQRFELRQQNGEALNAYRRALEESEKLLAAGNPRKPSAEIVLAISLGNVGPMEAASGDSEAGLEKVNRAIAICEKVLAADEKNYLAASELAMANWNAGRIYLVQNEPDRSLASFQKALDIQKRLQENNPKDLYNLGNLAETYASMGNASEQTTAADARKWYQLSYDIWKRLKDRNMLAGYYAHKPAELEQSLTRVGSR